MYINHEDIPKLPGSLIINSNGSLFRIFLTDDSITCYTCKSIGHTSNTCKKDFLNDLNSLPPHNPNYILTHENPQKEVTISTENTKSSQHLVIHDTTDKEDTHHPSLPTNVPTPLNIMNWNVENQDETPSAPPTHDKTEQTLIEPSSYSLSKRPLSDTYTPKSPNSPTTSDDKMPILQPDKKKPKIKSRSNSLTSLEDNKIDSMLKPAVAFFTNTENTSITMEQFKFFLENIGNNKINIHTLCEEINSNVSSMFELLENIRPLITERPMKTKLSKTANLLFKFLPLP
ncbi:general transcription factor II-I repeat domain-containing protein 2B-like [Aphis craccivora]|uniref:General transcription factor II-I repeat domain-containing protein 2B-like n=1 Tax=Aphis craccivora TaxID=307492 RepID=A0A6G0Y0W2_APHCR|nr:general transcription factor II-I repeat domain-containing protein 2B-like [Aphis craccivora]